MKDYYTVLEVSQDAGPEDIRKAYRRLALKYHPDHNPDSSDSKSRFLEITEAYGVLSAPDKRAEYDRARLTGTSYWGEEFDAFHYTQEEIFRDLFRDPRFQNVFDEMLKEFKRAGFRFDEGFFRKTLFGGKGILFGGVFFFGPPGSRAHRFPFRQTRKSIPPRGDFPPRPIEVVRQIGRKALHLLGVTRKGLPAASPESSEHDIHYILRITPENLNRGTWVQMAIDRGHGMETLKVKIPAETKENSRLRIRGKGKIKGNNSGDLYIRIKKFNAG